MNPYKETDKTLFTEVDKFMRGDESRYQKMCELSKEYVYKMIHDIVKEEQTTEEIMQNVFEQMHNKINTLEYAENFYVWAGRIATNLTLCYIQENRKEIFLMEEEEDNIDFIFDKATEDNEKFIPEDVLSDREKQRLIGEVVDNLSIEQKLCVQYFYYEEMSVSEIAVSMGCSEEAVKSQLNQARKSIKEVVGDVDGSQGTDLHSLASVPLFLMAFRAGVADLAASGAVTAVGAASVVGATGESTVVASGATVIGEAVVEDAAMTGETISKGNVVTTSTVSAGTKGMSGLIAKVSIAVGTATLIGGLGVSAVTVLPKEETTVQEYVKIDEKKDVDDDIKIMTITSHTVENGSGKYYANLIETIVDGKTELDYDWGEKTYFKESPDLEVNYRPATNARNIEGDISLATSLLSEDGVKEFFRYVDFLEEDIPEGYDQEILIEEGSKYEKKFPIEIDGIVYEWNIETINCSKGTQYIDDINDGEAPFMFVSLGLYGHIIKLGETEGTIDDDSFEVKIELPEEEKAPVIDIYVEPEPAHESVTVVIPEEETEEETTYRSRERNNGWVYDVHFADFIVDGVSETEATAYYKVYFKNGEQVVFSKSDFWATNWEQQNPVEKVEYYNSNNTLVGTTYEEIWY